jgi:hypothetical protein
MAVGCGIQQIRPRVKPSRIPPVAPPIQAHALLLIVPSFETFFHEEGDALGILTTRTQLGAEATKALSALVIGSFATADIKRLSEAEALMFLTSPSDTSITALLLAPSFDSVAVRYRQIQSRDCDYVGDIELCSNVQQESRLELTLHVDARLLRSGRGFVWRLNGRTPWVSGSSYPSLGGMLEQVLRALTDSLTAHRTQLVGTP